MVAMTLFSQKYSQVGQSRVCSCGVVEGAMRGVAVSPCLSVISCSLLRVWQFRRSPGLGADKCPWSVRAERRTSFLSNKLLIALTLIA